MNLCKNCNKETLNPRFCNSSCAAQYNNKKFPKRKSSKKLHSCSKCNKLTINNKYCSRKCSSNDRKEKTINKWLSGEPITSSTIAHAIRKYLIEVIYTGCAKCGWNEINHFSETSPLELHHIDNNPDNNQKTNVTILCPNCHSLTKGFKGNNKTNTRKYRKKYY